MRKPLSPAALGIKQRAIRKQNAAAGRYWQLAGRGRAGGRRAAKHRRESCRWARRAERMGSIDFVPMSAFVAPIPGHTEPAYD
jgi:hypothetical protein